MDVEEEVEEKEEKFQGKLVDQQRGSGTVVGGATALIVATEGAGRHVGPPQGGVGPYCTPPWWPGGTKVSGFTHEGDPTV